LGLDFEAHVERLEIKQLAFQPVRPSDGLFSMAKSDLPFAAILMSGKITYGLCSRESARGRIMQMNRLIVLHLVAGLACSTVCPGVKQATAQGVEEVDLSKLATLQADLQKAKAEDANLLAAISKGTQEAATLVEQHKALVEQLAALKPQGEALKTALNQQSAEAEKQRTEVAHHNAACPHEAKNDNQAGKCNGEMERLNAWATRIRAEMKKLEPSKLKYNVELADIQKRDAEILAQLNAIQTADAEQRKQIEALREHTKELRTQLSAAKVRCREIEKATKDPANEETLRYCKAMAQAETPVTQAPVTGSPANEPSSPAEPKH
jgi:septal ring factor EnvC (AmiA/AmiB activator)